jgi:hypothetical protein
MQNRLRVSAVSAVAVLAIAGAGAGAASATDAAETGIEAEAAVSEATGVEVEATDEATGVEADGAGGYADTVPNADTQQEGEH